MLFRKKQKLLTRWIVVRTLSEIKWFEIRGFSPENIVAIFKSLESAQEFMKTHNQEYGYLHVYPLIIEK